jgi:glucose/arabinose dehydrogenase
VKAELVHDGLVFPTSLAFDQDGRPYVAEAGLPFGGASPGGRVWRLEGRDRQLLVEDLRAPLNGLTFHDGYLYVSEGGLPGRISRLSLDCELETVIDNLPGPGNYHTNMTAFGPDGLLYFSQGAMTNSGVVGPDAYELGWLRRLPHAHDIPGIDIRLEGINFESEDPSTISGASVQTGAFSPFGTPSSPGQLISAGIPCTAAIMRCKPDGTALELVAWGLRNAYGLGFLADGRLLAIDQGADDRGSRPIGNAPDLLFAVATGAWYGWPDYIGGMPVSAPEFRPERGPKPRPLLSTNGTLPQPEPALLRFQAHAAATRFAEDSGSLYVAMFGDERPMTAPDGSQEGRRVARVSTQDWKVSDFMEQPFRRPIDVQVNQVDGCLYVLDFGTFEMLPRGEMNVEAGSGALWRVS